MPPNPRIASEPLIIIAELRFDPAHREVLLELAQRHVRNTLAAEPGCLRFELVAPKDEPGVLVFSEQFASEEAFATHRASPHVAWFREARTPYVSEANVRELRPVGPPWPGAVLCTVPLLERHTGYLAPLTDAGFDLRWGGIDRTLGEDELIERLNGVVATVAGVEPYTERVFAAAPDLKVVARLGVGYDQIDVEAATRHGVAVAMAYGANHDSVADHTLALMLAAAHRVVEYDQGARNGAWNRLLHGHLHERTAGIVGFGRIGRAVAKRCLGFNMDVLVADPVAEADTVARLGYQAVDLDELLARADFVSLHLPLTAETRHLIDAARLARMKPTAVLINTARGGLIDEAALVQALEARQIAAAALDVFETEPLPESPLRHLDQVVLTPHVAGLSAEAVRAMSERAVENVLAVLAGRDPGPGFLLNPEVLTPAS